MVIVRPRVDALAALLLDDGNPVGRSGRKALVRGGELARAACARVGRVGVDAAVRLAAHYSAARILDLQNLRARPVDVGSACGGLAILGRLDQDGQVEAVDQRSIILRLTKPGQGRPSLEDALRKSTLTQSVPSASMLNSARDAGGRPVARQVNLPPSPSGQPPVAHALTVSS